MTEVIILCALFGTFILGSFTIGLSFGVKLRNNEKIEIPNLNPVKAVKKAVNESKQERENEKEKTLFEIEMANIDSYDGTGFGQKELPR